jgi:hypothetical protein
MVFLLRASMEEYSLLFRLTVEGTEEHGELPGSGESAYLI